MDSLSSPIFIFVILILKIESNFKLVLARILILFYFSSSLNVYVCLAIFVRSNSIPQTRTGCPFDISMFLVRISATCVLRLVTLYAGQECGFPRLVNPCKT